MANSSAPVGPSELERPSEAQPGSSGPGEPPSRAEIVGLEKRVHFWSSFSLGSGKGRLLELIFALGELFGVIFGLFFDP